MTFQAIAARLGISAQAAEETHRRALRKLATLLQEFA
jgi:predicted DNA binding protein